MRQWPITATALVVVVTVFRLNRYRATCPRHQFRVQRGRVDRLAHYLFPRLSVCGGSIHSRSGPAEMCPKDGRKRRRIRATAALFQGRPRMG